VHNITDEDIQNTKYMAISILKKYKLPVTETAFQEGYLAMAEAATRFESSRGCKFSTFAWHGIRHRLCAHYGGYSRAWPKRGWRLKWYLEGRTIDADSLKNDINYSVNGNESKVIRKDLVYKALRSLTSDQRQTVTDYYFYDLTFQEIADRRGFDRKTHSNRLARALATMRAALST
jgi:RNA polymerase sigma factor (sigma-70 family)